MAASKRSRPRKAVWISVVALAAAATVVLLKGCTTTVIAPANVVDPVTVYIVDYGRHPALVLPRSETELIEYSYGEWEWYALNRNSFFDVFRALFVNSEGTLGRRSLYKPYDGATWWEDIPLRNLHRIMVERTLADDLLADLDDQWEAHRQTAVYNHVHGLDMVRHPQQYSAFTNSNIVLGRWLEDLDCIVRGWPLYPVHWRVVTE